MAAVSDITVKIKADTTDALRKIRQLQAVATSNPPLEVLVVAERPSSSVVGFLTGLVTGGVSALIGGAWLMLLVPLVGETFGLALGAPGYWRAAALVWLTRATYRAVFHTVVPLASKARSKA